MSERNEISLHEIRVYRALLDCAWHTNKAIAQIAGVAERTARAHTKRLLDLGICDVAEVFPGHRYRLSLKASKRNASYMGRLAEADKVFVENTTS